MKRLTITLDEAAAARARLAAAERAMSVSRFAGEVLRERMGEARACEEAMNRCLARAPFGLRAASRRYPRRDALHDRAAFRFDDGAQE